MGERRLVRHGAAVSALVMASCLTACGGGATFETWQRKMLALGQPPAGEAAWADLLKALNTHVEVIVEQQAAAARGDAQTFTKDYYEGNDAQDDMVRAAAAAGVPDCAAAAAA
jgi:hypothetical protein